MRALGLRPTAKRCRAVRESTRRNPSAHRSFALDFFLGFLRIADLFRNGVFPPLAAKRFLLTRGYRLTWPHASPFFSDQSAQPTNFSHEARHITREL
jgi:hypothetical protein